MVHDSITESIRVIRHALAAKLDNDIQRIGDDIRRQQRESGRTYLRLPKRQPRILATANKPVHGSGEVGAFPIENQSSPPSDR